jgi:hypothetical protein
VPTLDLQQQKKPPHIETTQMIDRMAIEMRARCGGELPHSFYFEKVRQRLLGRSVDGFAASDVLAHRKPPEVASVFHAWALRE